MAWNIDIEKHNQQIQTLALFDLITFQINYQKIIKSKEEMTQQYANTFNTIRLCQEFWSHSSYYK